MHDFTSLAPAWAPHHRAIERVLRWPGHATPQEIEEALARLVPLTRGGQLPAFRQEGVERAREKWAQRFAEANGWRVASRFDPRRLMLPSRRSRFPVALPDGAGGLVDHGFGLWRDGRPAALLGHAYPPAVEPALAAARALGLYAAVLPIVSVYNPNSTRVIVTTREPVDVVLPARRDTEQNAHRPVRATPPR